MVAVLVFNTALRILQFYQQKSTVVSVYYDNRCDHESSGFRKLGKKRICGVNCDDFLD